MILTMPDSESVMLDVLEPIAPAVTMVPTGWDGEPLFLVARVGGSDDGIVDRPIIQVDSYGPTRRAAWDLYSLARVAILGCTEAPIGTARIWVDRADVDTSGIQLPDVDPDDRRFSSTWRLVLRSQ